MRTNRIPGVVKEFFGAVRYPFLVSKANKIGIFLRCFRTRGYIFILCFLLNLLFFLFLIFKSFISWNLAISKASSTNESTAKQRSAYTTVDGNRKIHAFAISNHWFVRKTYLKMHAALSSLLIRIFRELLTKFSREIMVPSFHGRITVNGLRRYFVFMEFEENWYVFVPIYIRMQWSIDEYNRF